MNKPCRAIEKQITEMSGIPSRKIKHPPCILSLLPIICGGKAMTLLAMAVWASFSSTAHADCTSVSGIYTCENALTYPVLITENSDISVMTEDGFSVIASDPVSAMSIRGSGHISYLDNYASSLSNTSGVGIALHILNAVSGGHQDSSVTVKTDGILTGGIFIDNKSNGGAATVTLDATGTITMGVPQGNGIFSNNLAGEGDASQILSAGTITSESLGIHGNNSAHQGNATQAITAGTIDATQGEGIFSYNYTREGNASLTITAGTITSRYTGIYSMDSTGEGDASLTITAGTIITSEGQGIEGNNSSSQGNVTQTITVGTIDATQGYGIFSNNYASKGNSSLTISADTITAGGQGIDSYNISEGNASLTISAGTITAGGQGIGSYNISEGDVSQTISADTITAAQGSGINIENYVANGRSDIVVNVGQITSLLDAIHVYDYITGNQSDTSTIAVTTQGDIRSQQGTGILVETTDADSYITVAGLVSGGNGTAIDLQRQNGIERSATLELHAGYDLIGVTQTTAVDILGNAQFDVLNSHLVLGGNESADFDLSRIDNSVNVQTTGEANRITGFGTLVKSGDSVWTLTSANNADTADGFLYASVDAGTLALDNARLILAGANSVPGATGLLTIAPAGTLGGYGQVSGDVYNHGTLILGPPLTGQGYGTFIIDGNYTSDNGLLALRTVLGGDTSATDKLIVKGDTSGNTRVSVTNAGGTGAATIEGIQIVEIEGASNGTFSKEGRIVAGAYDYNIARSDNQNWYLTSLAIPDPEPTPTPQPETKHQYRPETGSYLANIMAANTLFNTRLHDRLGETQYTDALTGEQKVTSLWMRQIGGHNRFKDGSGQLSTQSNRYMMQLGGDIALWSNDGLDRWHLGLMAGYGNSKSRTHSSLTGYSSRGEINGYSVGVYGTWYANEQDKTGTYVDSWLLYNWFDNKVSGENQVTEKYDSDGITASLEAGYTFRLGESSNGRDSYWLQPKAQLAWMGVQADNHIEKNGTRMVDKTDGNLQTRLGVKGYLQGNHNIDDGQYRTFQTFVEANWIYNTHNYSVKMDDVSNEVKGAHNIGELKMGVEGQTSKRLQLWGYVAQQLGNNSYSDTQGMVGVKYTF